MHGRKKDATIISTLEQQEVNFMIFGNKKDFAIEVMIEPDQEPPTSIWGRMSIWVNDVEIGNFNERYCNLCSACDDFESTSSYLNSLWSKKFNNKSDLQIINFLDEKLYGYHGDIEIEDNRTSEDCCHDWDIYGKFNFLTNWGEMFNGYKAFLLKTPNGEIKILSRDFKKTNNLSLQCTEFTYRKAVKELSFWYQSLWSEIR